MVAAIVLLTAPWTISTPNVLGGVVALASTVCALCVFRASTCAIQPSELRSVKAAWVNSLLGSCGALQLLQLLQPTSIDGQGFALFIAIFVAVSLYLQMLPVAALPDSTT